MSLATDLQDDVGALLDDPDFGRDATLLKASAGSSYNAATGGVSGGTNGSQSIRVLLLNYRDYVVDGDLIRRSDRKAIIKAKSMTSAPASGDKLTVGSTSYTVLEVKTVELGGTDILYVAQVR